ncbi:MAG: rRNA maturation RNase YbeY [Thermodesulfobacteriota bacterium]
MGFRDGELSILLTGDGPISILNKRYLGREGPTNVLAFPMGPARGGPSDAGMMGDVVISLDTALRESAKIGEPLDRTVDRLLVHGILHLLDYDHERSPAEARRMRREESKLLALMEEG